MNEPAFFRLRYTIHGLDAEVACQIPTMLDPIGKALRDLDVREFSGKSSPITGIVRPFNQEEVLKYLSPTATRISPDNDLCEIYEEGERFWLIDDHWGLCELNVLKGQWRSWILENPLADPLRIAEQAVLWPMSQLLRPRGLCIIPGAAVTRDGWSALILGSLCMEPELSRLVRAGFQIVGQNWTALRDENGRIMMLDMPGSLERTTPRSPEDAAAQSIGDPPSPRVDLTREFCGSACDRAVCDAILLVAPGRRPAPKIEQVAPSNRLGAIRRDWPMAELHPMRRQGQLITRIAQRCQVFDIQLSRDPQEILGLLETARASRSQSPNPRQRSVA